MLFLFAASTELEPEPEPEPEPETIRNKNGVRNLVTKAPGGRYSLTWWKTWLENNWSR